MTRQTSMDAYRKIKSEGLLSKRRLEVYETLFHFGPMTANETFEKLYKKDIGPKNAASNSAARFSELRDMGVIQEIGERKCSVTGMNVISWDVTSWLPTKIKKPSKKYEIAEAVEKERKDCAQVAFDHNSNKIGNRILQRGHASLF